MLHPDFQLILALAQKHLRSPPCLLIVPVATVISATAVLILPLLSRQSPHGFLERGTPASFLEFRSQSQPFKINPCSCWAQPSHPRGVLSLSQGSNPCLPLLTPQFISPPPIPSVIPISCLYFLCFSSPGLSESPNAAHSCPRSILLLDATWFSFVFSLIYVKWRLAETSSVLKTIVSFS